ncbi:MAG: nucleotidyltransferase family protein [Deltaproteobacteria bacterium]|nr:nucleotidyltransferase family protein [Deltaproteobacteria bacterium]
MAWLCRQQAEQVERALASDLVDQLLLHAMLTGGLDRRLPKPLTDRLGLRRLTTAVKVIRQDHVMREVGSLLDEHGVEAVVFKGALVRHMLYAKPYLRPSADIDVLVAPADVREVARSFEDRGFSVTLASHSDTHEVWIERHGVGIDLHWTWLRPGRMRRDTTAEILATRVRRGDLWGPNDTHLTVLMLVHPAITDHVTGRLISAVDLDRWLRKAQIPWDSVVEVLDRIGLRTAAWAMLHWTRGLFGTPVPDEVWRALAPSLLRQRYIEAWLRRHPARLYRQRPTLVRGAFSLALQDRPSDAARALWRLARKDRLCLDQT